MIMERFNVKETNPICIYIANKRAELIEKVTGVSPFMDEEMRALADRTLDKLRAMGDAEFATRGFYPAGND
jgi:hypothetical protein